MGFIHEASLPPKNGYTEGVDENGRPVYRPTTETLRKQALEKENLDLKERIAFLEDCIAEMAMVVYAEGTSV